MKSEYHLARDPLFYFSISLFALLATGLPAILGQFRFMPLVQAVALTVFMAIPLRQHDLRGALSVVFLWLALSMALLLLLTWAAPGQVERAFEGGFEYRGAYAEWYYAHSLLPASFASQPLASAVEVIGVVLGSLLSAGLVGAWFVVKMANLAAFGAGSLLITLQNPLLLPVALPLWSLLQIAGAGGLLPILAEPLASGRWRQGIGAWWDQRRRLLLIFGVVYAAGLLLEIVLPPFWHFSARG